MSLITVANFALLVPIYQEIKTWLTPENQNFLGHFLEARSSYFRKAMKDTRQKEEENRLESQTFDLALENREKYLKEHPEETEKYLRERFPDQFKQEANQEAVLVEMLHALYEKSKDKPEAINLNDLDTDWDSQFREYSKNASKEYTQKLWGKILSGEITNPGSISKKTLRILNDLDTKTAEVFKELRHYISMDGFLCLENHQADERVKLLVEAGIVRDSPSFLAKKFLLDVSELHCVYKGKPFPELTLELRLHALQNAFEAGFLELSLFTSLGLQGTELTEAGKELKNIVIGEDVLDREIAARFIAERVQNSYGSLDKLKQCFRVDNKLIIYQDMVSPLVSQKLLLEEAFPRLHRENHFREFNKKITEG